MQRVGRSYRTGMALAFATGMLIGVAAVLARGLVVAAFTDDPGVAAPRPRTEKRGPVPRGRSCTGGVPCNSPVPGL